MTCSSATLPPFCNPTIRSLRTIEDFSQTVQAQRHVALRKICRSTLSDFNRLADPERLAPMLDALRAQLSRKQAPQRTLHEDDLSRPLQQTIAVDGKFLAAAADELSRHKLSDSIGQSQWHRAPARQQLRSASSTTSWWSRGSPWPEFGRAPGWRPAFRPFPTD
jgi:hypothetical protein